MLTRNFGLAWLLVMFVGMAMLAGCNEADFVTTSYKALKSGKVAYIAALSTAGDLYRQGKLSDAEKGKIIQAGDVYAAAHKTAVAALDAYVTANDSSSSGREAAALAAMAALSQATTEFSSIITPLLAR